MRSWTRAPRATTRRMSGHRSDVRAWVVVAKGDADTMHTGSVVYGMESNDWECLRTGRDTAEV